MKSVEIAEALRALSKRGGARWMRDPETGHTYCATRHDLITFELFGDNQANTSDWVSIEMTVRNVKRLFVPESPGWQIVMNLIRSASDGSEQIDLAKKAAFAAFTKTLSE